MIVTNETLLRQPCEPVDVSDAHDIISKLEIELEASGKAGSPGLGLAAPQIGILKKVAIIRAQGKNVNLVNPVILEKRNPIIFDGEGCLSFPGMVGKTNRYDEIVVKNNIEPKSFIATGLVAIVIQHEIDHLESKILPDFIIQEKVVTKKVRPNDPGHCGSGKKFKKCHMK